MSRNDAEESIWDRRTSGTTGGPDEQLASVTTMVLIPKLNADFFIFINHTSSCEVIVHQPSAVQSNSRHRIGGNQWTNSYIRFFTSGQCANSRPQRARPYS